MQEQVEAAVAGIRPSLQQHGGDIELVRIEDKAVYVRLQGACAGCPHARMTMEQGVERHIKEQVPEVDAVKAVE